MTTQPRSASQRRLLDSFKGLPLGEAGSAYLAKRGLLGVGIDQLFAEVSGSDPRHAPFAGRLAILSLGPDESVHDVTFRCIADHDCKDADCAKYLGVPHLEKRLFNARAVLSHGSVVDIAEGQIDALTLLACGLDAVGVAGASSWRPHYRRLFGGFDVVRVWGDGDKAGQDFAARVASDIPQAEVMMGVPQGEDINSLFVRKGREAILAIANGKAEENESDDTPPF